MSLQRPQKRGRYVSKACNQCKRRKTKCDGQEPCRVCSRKGTLCQFVDESSSIQATDDQIESLRHIPEGPSHQQLAAIQDRLEALEALTRSVHAAVAIKTSSVQVIDERHSRQEQEDSSYDEEFASQRQFPYAGPTSAQFILELVQESLKKTTSGSTLVSSDADAFVRPRRRTSSSVTRYTGSQLKAADSLGSLERSTLAEACRTYDILVGSMYPLVNLDLLEARISDLSRCSENDTMLLKAVVAIGLVVKAGDKSEMSERLVADLAKDTNSTLYCRRSSVHDIQLWGLMSLYYVHTGEESIASRLASLAARSCLEVNWHGHQTPQQSASTALEHSLQLNIFWSVYLLDRRASAGLGIPYTISDTDIDPRILPPPNDYLKSMLEFAKLSGKVQHSISAHIRGVHSFSPDEMDYLNFQFERWFESLPLALKLHVIHGRGQREDGEGEDNVKGTFLRLVLFARKNQARLLVYRPSLISAESAAQHPKHVSVAVDIAKETIITIADNASIYEKQTVVFNHFVLSSLAVLVLAATHASEQHSEERIRSAFQAGVSLIKAGGRVSQVTSRLWERVQHIDRLGVLSKSSVSSPERGPESSTALQTDNNTPFVQEIGDLGEAHNMIDVPGFDFDFSIQGSNAFYDLIGTTGSFGDMLPHDASGSNGAY